MTDFFVYFLVEFAGSMIELLLEPWIKKVRAKLKRRK